MRPGSQLKVPIFTFLSGCAIGIVVTALFLFRSSGFVSLTFVGYNTNEWTSKTVDVEETNRYVLARVALTNNTQRPVNYSSYFHQKLLATSLLRQTPAGWKEPNVGFRCGTGLETFVLPPAQGFVFEATIDQYEPCKVALICWDSERDTKRDGIGNKIMNLLPGWLANRLPLSRGFETITTDVIDVSQRER